MLFLLCISISYSETLEEVIKIALEKSPYIKKYQYQIKSVEGELIDINGYYNPEVSIEFGRLYSQTDSGIALTSFSIMERLRLWGEMKFAVNSIKYKKEAFEYLLQQEKNNLIGQVYQSYYDALYIKEQINIKKKELKIVEGIYNFVKKSYEAGETIPLDLLRAERDLELVKLELKNLEAQYKGKLNNLSALVGQEIKDTEGNLFNYPDLKDIEIDKLPIAKYYKSMEKSLSEEIKRQRALGKPQISVGLVGDEDAVETGKYEFGIAISSTIPIFNKNKGKVIQAISQKDIISQEKKAKLLNFKYNLETIKEQYKLYTKQIKKVDDNLIPKLKEALSLAEKGYKYGTTTFLEYSSVRKQYFETLLYKAELSYQIHKLYGEYIKIGGYKK
jgi:outer membrane protein TolC